MAAEGYNRVFLFGYVGTEPELSTSDSGLAILQFRLATPESRKKGEQWFDHTEWHNIVIFGKRAQALSNKLDKGTRLFIEGSLRTSSYEHDDGHRRWRTDIIVRDLRFAGRVRLNDRGAL